MLRNFVFLVLCVFNAVELSKGNRYRLPTTVEPLFYKLKIIPDLDKEVFTGEVSININVKDLVHSIVLHSANLSLHEVSLDDNAKAIDYKLDPQYELVQIFYQSQSCIAAGHHKISIKFSGSLAGKEQGFFKANFTTNETISHLAVTDFQPTFARNAFPCFDEPAFKAKFQLSLGAPNKSYTALSNMRKIAEFEVSNGVMHKFETSVVMSPYLLAFAICQYSSNLLTIFDGLKNIPIKGYSLNPPNDTCANDCCQKQVNKPLCTAAQALNFYTTYLEYPYPLPKIDFMEYDREISGATENWGLITMKKGLVRVGLGIYTEGQVNDVVAHEIAHFWFGNLVTNNWWDDIWLQEGFAVFMSLKVQDFIYNNNSSSLFSSQYLEDIYLTDAKESSEPVVKFLETPQDISNHFNDVTYIKGAAILRMVEMVLGQDNFKFALREYIKTFAYKTATSNDLINIFQKYDYKVDMKNFIDSYLYQSRYPMLHIEEDLDTNVYVVKQYSCSYKFNDSSSNFKWTIPITYITDLNKSPTLVWFHEEMNSLIIPKGSEKWIKMNEGQIGLYRVRYSDGLWAKLEKNLAEIASHERDHILAEATQLYFSDLIPCKVALTLMNKLNALNLQHSHVPMWIFTFLNEDEMKSYDEDALKILHRFMKNLMKKKKQQFKRDVESEDLNNLTISEVPERVKICANWIKNNLNIT